jgi:hypothetical protein
MPEPTCDKAPEVKRAPGEACACDNECANATCILGLCCMGDNCAKLPEGARCTSSSMCSSGFCADGVCCNTPCSGACVSCNQAGKAGECRTVASGQPDPHARCRVDPPDSCGENGLCNGQGGCTKHEAGTVCKAAGCSDGRTLKAASACDGNGQCIAGVGLDCAPWTCSEGICKLSCTDDTQCTPPARCRVEGGCGKFPLGSKCGKNDDCLSNFCVDGVCCDNACADKCAYCAFPNSPGRCTAVPVNARDPRAAAGVRDAARVCLDQGEESCGTNGRCDGNKACQRYPNGTVCRDADCDSGSNSDTDQGTCKSGTCSVPKADSCSPFRGCQGNRCMTFCASDSNCSGDNVCIKGSCGKRPIGAACSSSDECASPGICAQGRCCASACSGVCQSCALPGSQGTCSPVPEGGADPTGSCKDDACSNGCDGSGKCRRESTGATCKAATCGANNTLVTFACTAQGVCQMNSSACGNGQVCMGNRCATVAQDPGGQCVAGSDCKSGACVNGRCCESACSGGCTVCSAATAWKCSPITCPSGSVCNPKTNGCDPIERGPGESCGGSNGMCRSGLTCLGGICCMASACGGNVCLSGKCRSDGSGCEAAPNGRDCGTTCSNATTLVTKTCTNGSCVSMNSTCSSTQVCNTNRCEMKPPPNKGPGEACDTSAECRDGLSCIRNICCMANACSGPCLTGACQPNGSGCAQKMSGSACGGGPTCASSTSVSTKACNDAGMCATNTTNCPSGQVCMMGACEQPAGHGPGGSCMSTSNCLAGLTCIAGTCCMASSCTGACLTGACRNNGSGCQPRNDNVDCGTTCASATSLTTKKCDGNGMCVTTTLNCPTGSMCSENKCGPVMGGGAGPGEACGGGTKCRNGLSCAMGRCCLSDCKGMCFTGACDEKGQCTIAVGQDCMKGNSGMTCQPDGTCSK